MRPDDRPGAVALAALGVGGLAMALAVGVAEIVKVACGR